MLRYQENKRAARAIQRDRHTTEPSFSVNAMNERGIPLKSSVAAVPKRRTYKLYIYIYQAVAGRCV